MMPDLTQTLQQILGSLIAKLDLVTRAEFNTQQKLLDQTKAKLTDLEKRLEELHEEV